MTHHVTFGDIQKIINCGDPKCMALTIMNTFSITLETNQEFVYKLWNDEWNDWVDIQSEDIPGKGKLKILIKEKEDPILSTDEIFNEPTLEEEPTPSTSRSDLHVVNKCLLKVNM